MFTPNLFPPIGPLTERVTISRAQLLALAAAGITLRILEPQPVPATDDEATPTWTPPAAGAFDWIVDAA